jgi:dihydroorotase
MLQVIKEARSRGIDITTECYPYSAGMTGIEAATFDGNWKQNMGIDYGDLEWAETGERLTEESFNRYRETGGMVILHMIPESVVDTAVNSPLTSIASDGYIKRGKGHPRTAGTYSRVLGKYVRCGDLTMVSAIRKMSLMPAQRLETRVPMMKQKGRLQLGSDADIVIFDPETISDMSTYQQPTVPSRGIHHVLVNGIQVVNKSKLVDNTVPGCPIRAPLS